MTSNSEWERLIDSWTASACKRGESIYLEELLNYLPGVYPVDAAASARRLQINLKAPVVNMQEVWCQDGIVPIFPLEHPLDYEWHFAKSGQRKLFTEIKRLIPLNSRVLCLGCPSLAQTHESNGLRLELWDKNIEKDVLGEAFFLRRVDLGAKTPKCEPVTAVIIDPPWYPLHYSLFLHIASKHLSIGGILAVSFPPIGTRPRVGREKESFIKDAQSCGLTLLAQLPLSLPYRTPLFEVNALKAAGIQDFLPSWRRGDLFLFRKTQLGATLHSPIFQSNSWEEVRIGAVRIKVNLSFRVAQEQLLTPIYSGEVMPSVSSHFPKRALANVVTSGNRFFVTAYPEKVLSLLRMVNLTGASEECPADLQAWLSVLKKEQKEANNYMSRFHEV